MTVRELVREHLDNAARNGYTFPNETPEEIAEDMITFSAYMEGYEVKDIAPFIKEIREKDDRP